MKEALITALTRVDIKDLALSLQAGQATFIKNREASFSKDLKELLGIGAVKLEWVNRDRLRKVPDMRTYQEAQSVRSPPAPVTERASSPPVAKTPAAEAPAVESAVSKGPVDEKILSLSASIESKFQDMESKIDQLSQMVSSFPELRSMLQDVLKGQVQQDTSSKTALQSSPDSDSVPMFIPSKIMEEGMNSDLKLEDSASVADISSATSSLKSVRRKKT